MGWRIDETLAAIEQNRHIHQTKTLRARPLSNGTFLADRPTIHPSIPPLLRPNVSDKRAQPEGLLNKFVRTHAHEVSPSCFYKRPTETTERPRADGG
jgi:hypothetical protein